MVVNTGLGWTWIGCIAVCAACTSAEKPTPMDGMSGAESGGAPSTKPIVYGDAGAGDAGAGDAGSHAGSGGKPVPIDPDAVQDDFTMLDPEVKVFADTLKSDSRKGAQDHAGAAARKARSAADGRHRIRRVEGREPRPDRRLELETRTGRTRRSQQARLRDLGAPGLSELRVRLLRDLCRGPSGLHLGRLDRRRTAPLVRRHLARARERPATRRARRLADELAQQPEGEGEEPDAR